MTTNTATPLPHATAATTNSWQERVAATDWEIVGIELDAAGCATLGLIFHDAT